MGALIAGMYAAGQLQEAKEWFLHIDEPYIWRMADINLFSGNSLVKGERIIQEIQKIVPDRPIEQLNIPCAIVAADMISSEEVIFRTGSLFQAVRASISIPLFFQPVQMEQRLLIDGGVLNPLPLNIITRTQEDILVAMDICGQDSMPLEPTPEKLNIEERIAEIEAKGLLIPQGIEDQLMAIEGKINAFREEKAKDLQRNINFFNLVDRMNDMQIQQNTKLTLQITPPDVHAVMKQYAYSTFDFDRAEEIIAQGHTLMNHALDQYEQQ
jgi:NTE family protein